MKRIVYLHVGFHKTATTFLQWKVFPQLSEVNLIKKADAKKLLTEVRLKKLSDNDIKRIRSGLESKVSDSGPILVSYEGWTGSPFSQKKSKSAYTILKDLHRLFPQEHYDVHLIIGIRKQVDIMTSLYVEFLHQGGTKTEEAYFEELRKNNKLRHYLYNDYLTTVEQLFGDNYFVFIYENFKKEQENYLLRLLNYIGVENIPEYNNVRLNRSYGVLQAKLARLLNKLFKSKKNPKGKIPQFSITLKRKNSRKLAEILTGKPKRKVTISPRTLLKNNLSFKLHYKRYELPKTLQDEINQYYEEDNLKLAKRDNINLPEYYHLS
ncbi:hypothetical protein SAMN05216238_108139 [Lentibacillus persicus]|uniref:Sulfotransferase domain-containing protein n=1 Tax=Lentibacillus persicus TaxID=640948 RepID=A0A1I1XV55_9BACI|nr:hypothetical protein [Lentibacillus persicus]SFE11235.1 hypothetical protein SAMN05216238_108139 [Lentibacillus persicus]